MTEVAIFLALVLMVSAGHKLIERERMAVATARLTGVSAAMSAPLTLAVAALELLGALGLMLSPARAVGVIVAVIVWSGYAIALFRHRGETLDCGCTFAAREKRVDDFAVLRPVMLAALAVPVAFVPAAPLSWSTPFAALAFLSLYLAIGELTALPHRKREQAA